MLALDWDARVEECGGDWIGHIGERDASRRAVAVNQVEGVFGGRHDVTGNRDQPSGPPHSRLAHHWRGSTLETGPHAAATESSRECFAEVAVARGRDGYTLASCQRNDSSLPPHVTWYAFEPTARKEVERDDSVGRGNGGCGRHRSSQSDEQEKQCDRPSHRWEL